MLTEHLIRLALKWSGVQPCSESDDRRVHVTCARVRLPPAREPPALQCTPPHKRSALHTAECFSAAYRLRRVKFVCQYLLLAPFMHSRHSLVNFVGLLAGVDKVFDQCQHARYGT